MKAKNDSRKRLGLVCLWLCAGSLLWGATDSYGQAMAEKGRSKSKEPLHITSNKMEVNSRKNIIVFIGDVKANQGDMRIQANRLEVYTREDEQADSKRTAISSDGVGKVDRIVATGDVLMDQAKRRFATADRLEYQESTGIAVLTGSPRAWEGQNQLVGARIELNLREEKTIVHGSPRQRVGVTLFPSSETPRRQKPN